MSKESDAVMQEEECDHYINKNHDDIHRMKDIAQKNVKQAIDEVFNAPSPSQAPALRKNYAPTKTSQNEFKAFGDAVMQTMERTYDHFISADSARPKIRVSESLKGIEKTIRFRGAGGLRRVHILNGLVARHRFDLRLKTDTSKTSSFRAEMTRYVNAVEGRGEHSDINIPASDGAEILEVINNSENLEDFLIVLTDEMMRCSPMFNQNIDDTKQARNIVKEHLNHALAATFGAEFRPGKKPLELASFDKEQAEDQFRTELKALNNADKSDLYLLTAFGLAARNQSGADASIVAEWQTGRMLAMPASFDKVKHVNATLEQMLSLSGEERAANARGIMSQIRSLQKTMQRDNELLAEEAKSIHGAKTIMEGHTEILTRYVQGFESMRGILAKKFGEETTTESSGDLLISLAAAQAHSGNQSVTHERLTHRMMKNLSRLSTQMSFVSQSMSQLVAQTVKVSVEGDDATREKLEQNIEDKISTIREALEPYVTEIAQIDEQLSLIEAAEPTQMIEAELANIKLLPAPEKPRSVEL